MTTRLYQRDARVILKAARSLGDEGLITPKLAQQLARGFRMALKLSPADQLVLLQSEPAANRMSNRDNHKRKRRQQAQGTQNNKPRARK